MYVGGDTYNLEDEVPESNMLTRVTRQSTFEGSPTWGASGTSGSGDDPYSSCQYASSTLHLSWSTQSSTCCVASGWAAPTAVNPLCVGIVDVSSTDVVMVTVEEIVSVVVR